jgi:hypothetical protein
MINTFITGLTLAAGYVMLGTQLTLCLGNLYLGKGNAALYWGGGFMLTIGAIRMGGT